MQKGLVDILSPFYSPPIFIERRYGRHSAYKLIHYLDLGQNGSIGFLDILQLGLFWCFHFLFDLLVITTEKHIIEHLHLPHQLVLLEAFHKKIIKEKQEFYYFKTCTDTHMYFAIIFHFSYFLMMQLCLFLEMENLECGVGSIILLINPILLGGLYFWMSFFDVI